MAKKEKPLNTWSRQFSEYEVATIKILRQASGPLTVPEIVKKIVAQKLVTVRGKTPAKSLYSILSRKEQKRAKRGEKLIFKKVKGKGKRGIGLTLNHKLES